MTKLKMCSIDTAYLLYIECKKLFPCHCSSEKDLKNIINDRNGDYMIEFADNIEADEYTRYWSAKEVKERGIQGITLSERLKMEIEYFKKTGKHLDNENITLCTGSHDNDNGVPKVNWDSDRLDVGWYDSDCSNNDLRTRVVITTTMEININNDEVVTLRRNGKFLGIFKKIF